MYLDLIMVTKKKKKQKANCGHSSVQIPKQKVIDDSYLGNT